MFTVTANGNVNDVKVIVSSHSGFERNAVRAAEKFKYKPKVVDGIAVEVNGVTN
ncbi:MAG: TonB family protein [Emcibacteraceae bacterium]|nr:TonB family protein [Emcibacteraceae bacterium]MDG1727167.1 TonB family protein [Emcibacteraceae bacterium]